MSGRTLPEAELLEHHVGFFTWPMIGEDDRINPMNLDDIVYFDELGQTRDNP